MKKLFITIIIALMVLISFLSWREANAAVSYNPERDSIQDRSIDALRTEVENLKITVSALQTQVDALVQKVSRWESLITTLQRQMIEMQKSVINFIGLVLNRLK